MSDTSPTNHSLSGRKGSRKVRTGCITCKVRKVKCDEEKPFCLRCSKSGRKCDGYLDPGIMASRRKAVKDRVGASPYSAFSALLEWALPEEKRSLHFFQQVTAPHLAGDLDAIFWKVLVLQVCQTEPAVRHAVLAVSSLHESLTLGAHAHSHSRAQAHDPQARPLRYPDGSAPPSSSPLSSSAATPGSDHSFALQQYNKAISCLLGQMRDPTAKPLAPLLTCVLFVCLEFMHGKDKESLIHLEQGRQILSKLGRRAPLSKDPEMDIIKRHIVPIYLRLSVTSFLIGAKPAPVPKSLKTLQDLPAVFESVQEIRFALYDFMDETLRFTHRTKLARYGTDVPAETFAELAVEREDLLRRLGKFNVAFSLYQVGKPAHMSQAASAVFQMYLLMMKIWIATALSYSEAAFDDHLASFSAIIPLAATILNCETPSMSREFRSSRGQMPTFPGFPDPSHPQQPGRPSDHDRQRRSIFTFETYVIPVLYYVATKCRHPLIRHSALDLLKQNPHRRENLWKAGRMAAIAEHIIKVEEASAVRSPGSINTRGAVSSNQTSVGSVAVRSSRNFGNDTVVSTTTSATTSAGRATSAEADYHIRGPTPLPSQIYPDKQPMVEAFEDLIPSIEPAAIAAEFMRSNASIGNEDGYQQQQQRHMDIDLLHIEGDTVPTLEDMGLEMPIDPCLVVRMDGSDSRAASYTSQDDVMAPAENTGEINTVNGFLAPSPLPQLTRSASASRASSVESNSPPTAYLGSGGEWQIGSSTDSDQSLSPASDQGGMNGGMSSHNPAYGAASPPVGLGIHQQQYQYQQYTPQQQQQQQHGFHHPPQQQQQDHILQEQQHHQTQQQYRHNQHQQIRSQQRQLQHHQPGPPPRPNLRDCNTEAPFDIPENIRVHDVLIGPERDDGSWLTVFRKLQGPAEEWNVHTEYITV